MSKLAELAATPTANTGVRWEPPPELVAELVAAKANGYGWETISDALKADGVTVGKDGVRAWFKRRELAAARDRAD